MVGRQKGHPNWSFARLIAPAVTTTSITLSCNKIQNGDTLVLANPGPPEKWPLKLDSGHRGFLSTHTISVTRPWRYKALLNCFDEWKQIAVPGSTEPSDQLNVEVENGVRVASFPAVHRLRCSSGAGQVIWEAIVTSKINAVATNRLTAIELTLLLSLSILMAIFPGEPGLAGFIETKDVGSGGDNWSYKSCTAPVKSPLPTNQHPTLTSTNTPTVCEPRAGSGVVRMDPLSFLAGCRTRRLNQA